LSRGFSLLHRFTVRLIEMFDVGGRGTTIPLLVIAVSLREIGYWIINNCLFSINLPLSWQL